MPPPSDLGALLEHAGRSSRAVHFLDRRGGCETVPCAELLDRARAAAGRLQSAGVRRGAHVGILAPTGPCFVTAFFGAILAGAAVTPLPVPMRLNVQRDHAEHVAELVRRASLELIVTTPRLEPLANARPALVLDEAAPPAPFTPLRLAPDDVTLIHFSSGTTGTPRPVALTHRQVLANARAILDHILAEHGPGEQASMVSWLPLYHDMGLLGGLITTLLLPGELTLMAPETFLADPALWLKAISARRATVSAAPSFGYALCASRVTDADLTALDLSSWRVALNGAEAVSAGVIRRFADRLRPAGFRPEAMRPVYGLAEAALAVTFSAPGSPPRAVTFDTRALLDGAAVPAPAGTTLVSVGRALAGYTVHVVDENDRALPEARVGEVIVRGPSVMAGYWDMPAETAAAVRDGALRTGDRGFLLDGELFLFGRAKDVIVVRGQKYSPAAIEDVVGEVCASSRMGVAAASTLLPGDARESLFVFVETRLEPDQPPGARLAKEIGEAVLGRTLLAIDHVVFVKPGALPRTTSGKIRRNEALRRHLTETALR